MEGIIRDKIDTVSYLEDKKKERDDLLVERAKLEDQSKRQERQVQSLLSERKDLIILKGSLGKRVDTLLTKNNEIGKTNVELKSKLSESAQLLADSKAQIQRYVPLHKHRPYTK